MSRGCFGTEKRKLLFMGEGQYLNRVVMQLEFGSGRRMVNMTMGEYNIYRRFIENRDLSNNGLGICARINYDALFFPDEIKITIGE